MTDLWGYSVFREPTSSRKGFRHAVPGDWAAGSPQEGLGRDRDTPFIGRGFRAARGDAAGECFSLGLHILGEKNSLLQQILLPHFTDPQTASQVGFAGCLKPQTQLADDSP